MARRKTLVDQRYRVESVLGMGASAVVYLATHEAIGRRVALKVLKKEACKAEAQLARYLREAQVIASLSHPNIVTVHDVGALPDGRPYMVMEYVRGYSLQEALKHWEILPLDVAWSVFEQVASALGHAHRNQVVHRDVKPANILMESSSLGYDIPKVADFGVALVGTSELTHPGTVIGTPVYMSPEQACGDRVGPPADQYALGVVMFRALTGQRPFTADDAVALAMRHVHEPIPRFCDVTDRQVPERLERIVRRCMAKDPRDRFPNAAALQDALREAHEHHSPMLAPRVQEADPSLDTEPEAPIRSAQPHARRGPPSAMWIAGACAAAFVGTFGTAVPVALRYAWQPEPAPAAAAAIHEVAEEPAEPRTEPEPEPFVGPEEPEPFVGPERPRRAAVQAPPPLPPGAAPRASARALRRAGRARDVALPEPAAVVEVATAPPSRHELSTATVARSAVGRWKGELDGKPLTLELRAIGGERVRGKLRWGQGLRTRNRTVSGSVGLDEAGSLALSLSDPTGWQLEGEIGPEAASGLVLEGGRPAGAWWLTQE